MDTVDESVCRRYESTYKDHQYSRKQLIDFPKMVMTGPSDKKSFIHQVEEALQAYSILWLRLEAEMNHEAPPPPPPPPRHRSTPSAAFPFPIAAAHRHRIQRPVLGTHNTLPQVTGGEANRHRPDQLPVIQPMNYESSLTSLPHLPSSSAFTAVRRNRIPRRIVDVPPIDSDPSIRSAKMVRSAKVYRADTSPVGAPYPRAPHPTPIPPSTRPSSRRLVPLVPQRPSLFYPTTAADMQIADALKPYESVTKTPNTSVHHCCQLPCRPLIHSRPRANQSRPLLPRRPGRTQAPAWTPPPSVLGVRQNVLISYYTTPPEVKEEAATTPAKHPRRKKVLPGEFTHIPSACKVSQSGARAAKTSSSSTYPAVTSNNNSRGGDSIQREVQHQEEVEEIASKDEATEAENIAATNDSRKLAAPETVLLPPGDASEKQGVEETVQQTGEAVIGVVNDDSSCPSLSTSDVGSEMKGIKQDSADVKMQVAPTGAGGSDEDGGGEGDRILIVKEEGAAVVQPIAMNTCVSIVIEAVDEEGREGKESGGEEDDQAAAAAASPDQQPLKSAAAAEFVFDEMMPAPPLIKTPEEEGEIPSQTVEEVELDNPEIKLQSILDYVKIRRNEFAKLLEEHAEIVHEINKFEGGVTS